MIFRNYGYVGSSVVAIFEDESGKPVLHASLEARQAALLLNGTAEWWIKGDNFVALVHSDGGAVVPGGNEWNMEELVAAIVPE